MELNFINSEGLKEALNEAKCSNSPFIEIGAENFEISAFEIEPIEGYEEPVGENGQKFPLCCEFHESIYRNSLSWLQEFPACCSLHRKLVGVPWFNKENYSEVTEKIVKQVSFTEHHIKKRINNDDWYKDIVDYIYYNIVSFGSLPLGYGNPVGLDKYLLSLKHWVKFSKVDGFSEQKRLLLISYLNGLHKRDDSKKSSTSLNVLYVTYQKWLKAFPFDIGFFESVKEYFVGNLPIIEGEISYNPYLKTSSGKIITNEKLVSVLANSTLELLSKINSVDLIKKKLIPDIQEHAFRIVSEQHKLRQMEVVQRFEIGELKYVKVLKEWLKNEKQYFKEIEAMLPKQQVPGFVTATVTTLNFSVLSGADFERLVYCYAVKEHKWNKLEWLGQSGKDSGRDIWGEYDNTTVCYQCANHATYKIGKAKKDINALYKGKNFPKHLVVVCGNKVSSTLRSRIENYAKSKLSGLEQVSVWSGAEFEEKLRNTALDLVDRFFNGNPFPKED